jgi:hypothetical protein
MKNHIDYQNVITSKENVNLFISHSLNRKNENNFTEMQILF